MKILQNTLARQNQILNVCQISNEDPTGSRQPINKTRDMNKNSSTTDFLPSPPSSYRSQYFLAIKEREKKQKKNKIISENVNYYEMNGKEGY